MRLTDVQTVDFNEDGYLLVDRLFSDDDLQPVINELTQEIDVRAQGLVDQGKIENAYEEEAFETRLTRLGKVTEEVYWSISSGQLSGPAIFDLLKHPKMLDMVECLVGPEIIASSAYRVRPKVPGFAHGVVPWHQDSTYFEPFCDPSLVLTVWFPLVDATLKTGCLEVLPKAHLDPLVKHLRGNPFLFIAAEEMPQSNPVLVPVPKCGALLLSNHSPHKSGVNAIDVIRWSFDMRYQSAALPTNAMTSDGPLREQQDPEEPSTCYPPEADILVRSLERPGDVVAEWERFDQLHRSYTPRPMTQRWG